MKKILLIQTAFIGDAVLATGLCEKLHQHFPDCQIDFLLRKGNEGLLQGHPFVHTLIWDKKKSKYAHLWSTLQYIRKQHYDLVINVQRFAATGLLTAFSGAKKTIGFDKNPLSFLFTQKIKHRISIDENNVVHEVERNHDLVKEFTDNTPALPALYPTKEDEQAVAQYKGKPYICIAPSSVWFTKQLPSEKWIDLVNKRPKDLTVYLLGAPGDFELCEKIIQGAGCRAQGAGFEDAAENKNASPSPITNLSGKLSFLQSAALMKDARMNYVNDSAPMHFASAVNAPTTAVYCSTMPYFGFGPLSGNQHIIQIQQPLPCRPCGLHGKKACPLGHFKCAYNIHTEQLQATVTG